MPPFGRNAFSVSMPVGICANCGRERPTKMETIELTHSTSYLVVRTTRTIKLEVPFCSECLAVVHRMQWIGGATIILGVMAAAVVAVATRDYTGSCVIGVSALVFGGIIIAGGGPSRVASYDGNSIEFANADFNARLHGRAATTTFEPEVRDLVDQDLPELSSVAVKLRKIAEIYLQQGLSPEEAAELLARRLRMKKETAENVVREVVDSSQDRK